MIEIELPWPPSVNHYKKVGRLTRTKSGKLFQPKVNSDETKRFYYEVWIRICQAKVKEGFKSLHYDTISLGVDIEMHPPDNRRRDIDNGLKTLIDSLVRGGLIKDDSQIIRLMVSKLDTISYGKVIVRISEIV